MPAQQSVSSASFDCDAFHKHCHADRQLFPRAFTVRPGDVEKRRRASDQVFSKARPIGMFQHIPKAGGTTIESFLHIPFQDHMSMHRKASCCGAGCAHSAGVNCRHYKEVHDKVLPFFVLLRHPVDRWISEYFYIKGGDIGPRYAMRQRHFCKPRTGKEFHNEYAHAPG